jgi:hypothetical protein
MELAVARVATAKASKSFMLNEHYLKDMNTMKSPDMTKM